MQGRVDALSKRERVDPVVTLKRFHAADLSDGRVDLFGRSRRVPVHAEYAYGEATFRPPLLENVQNIRRASGHAKGSKPCAIDVFDQLSRTRLKFVWSRLGKPCCHRAGCGDVAHDDSGGTPCGVTLN